MTIGAAPASSTRTVLTVDSTASLPAPTSTVYRPPAPSTVWPLMRMSPSGEAVIGQSDLQRRADACRVRCSGVSGADCECWITAPARIDDLNGDDALIGRDQRAVEFGAGVVLQRRHDVPHSTGGGVVDAGEQRPVQDDRETRRPPP